MEETGVWKCHSVTTRTTRTIQRDVIMIITKPARLLAPTLFCAALGFAQPASAITVSVGGTTAEIICLASGVVSPECQGFTGAGSTGFPTGLGTLSGTAADQYDVSPSNPTNETSALNTLAGTSFTLTDFAKTDTSGVDSFSFDTLAEYFMIKLGAGHFFFQNNAGLATLSVTYNKNGVGGGSGAGGLSHIAEWGVAVIPLPAALPMFLASFGGLLWVGRRRRRGIAGEA